LIPTAIETEKGKASGRIKGSNGLGERRELLDLRQTPLDTRTKGRKKTLKMGQPTKVVQNLVVKKAPKEEVETDQIELNKKSLTLNVKGTKRD